MSVTTCDRCGCGCHEPPAPRATLVGLGEAPRQQRDTLPCPPPDLYEGVERQDEPEWAEEAITEVQCPDARRRSERP